MRKRVPAKWRKLLRDIPGYDPFRDAEGCWFDVETAQRALDFFPECLTHVKGEWAGRPVVLERWQKAIIANLFGWLRRDEEGNVVRRYREGLILVPRKNGKTTIVAGIALFMLFCDGEPGAEVYVAASETEQAGQVYATASGMVLAEPELAWRARLYKGTKAIVYEATGSIFKTLSSDAKTKHGFHVHCAICEELHAHEDGGALVRVLITGTGARRQPLVLHITTRDFDRPSICNEKVDYAKKVRDGEVDDPAFLPVLYYADEEEFGDKWTDPKVWARVNPNLGVSVKRDYLKREYRRATESAVDEAVFKRLHLNIKTQAEVPWLKLSKWDVLGADFSGEDCRGQECYGGLDLSSTTDLSAFVLLFPGGEEYRDRVLSFFWVPGEGAEVRGRRDKVPYLAWAQEGWLRLTRGDVIDYDEIVAVILECAKLFRIKEIGFDRWGAEQIQKELQDEGLMITSLGQGFETMSAPTKELRRMVHAGEIEHDMNPVLRWCVGNTMVETNASEGEKPTKKKSRERIDGLVALVLAVATRTGPTGPSESVYESRGPTIA